MTHHEKYEGPDRREEGESKDSAGNRLIWYFMCGLFGIVGLFLWDFKSDLKATNNQQDSAIQGLRESKISIEARLSTQEENSREIKLYIKEQFQAFSVKLDAINNKKDFDERRRSIQWDDKGRNR